MADESLVTLEQARQLDRARRLRLFQYSTCPKTAASAAAWRSPSLAQEAGIKIQVGAQVGETGILSAAGRTLAAHLPALAFAEGSFGTWLLAEDVTFENVAFGFGRARAAAAKPAASA